MDACELVLTLFVSIIAGCVSLILLKIVFPDFILSQLIDIFEYIGSQFYYQLSPLKNAEWAPVQDNTYNGMQMAFDMIHFAIGFVPTFGFMKVRV